MKKIILWTFLVAVLLVAASIAYWKFYRSPPPPSVPPQVATFSSLLRQKLDSKQWDEKTLLIENLKIWAREKTPAQVYGNVKIRMPEFNPIRRRALYYLQHGEDEAAKKEIQRLLDKIFPPLDKLNTGEAPPKTSLEDLFIPSALAQTRSCFGGICYQVFSYNAHGFTHMIYIDERLGLISDIRTNIAQALEDSYRTYQGLGLRMSPAAILVQDTPFTGGGGDASASAGMSPSGSQQVCRVDVWSGGVTELATRGWDFFKQVLAHEFFHCAEEINLMAPAQNISPQATDWWVEGGAEFFSNVVYPNVNAEDIYNADFDSNSATIPTYQMSYEANVFWQFLADRIGNAGVLSFFRSLPTSGGSQEQGAALAGLANIENLFHEFGEAYLDGKIMDTGGGARPLSPQVQPALNINHAGNYGVSTQPFILTRRRLNFDPGNSSFHVETRTEDQEKYSTKKSGESHWDRLPQTIGGSYSCDESEAENYWLVLTSTQAAPSEYRLTMEVSNEGGAGGPTPAPPPGVDPSARDACLNGRWRVDPSSSQAGLQAMFSAIPVGQARNTQITHFNLDAELCFRPSGRFGGRMTYAVGTLTPMEHGMVMNMDMDINMTGQGQYSASGATLAILSHQENMQGTIHIDIAGRGSTKPMQHVSGTGTPTLQYTCRGDNLDIQVPKDPFPMVHLTKMRAEHPPHGAE